MTTILLARSADGMEDSAKIFERAGFTVRRAPVIQIVPPESWEPLDALLQRLGSFDAIVCTSANGIRMLAQRATDLAGDVTERLRHLPVYVVGESSADAGRAEGLRTVLLPKVIDGPSLATALIRHLAKESRVAVVRGDLADATVPTMLHEGGIAVHDAVAYRTIVANAEECARIAEQWKATAVDVVLFFSPSAVDGLTSCVDTGWLRQRRVIALGHRTASKLASIQVPVAFKPTSPSVEEVVSYLTQESQIQL